jgi:hypothetical protein
MIYTATTERRLPFWSGSMSSHSERRQFKRFGLPCPIRVAAESGDTLAHSRTINISDGGLLVSMPVRTVPRCGSKIQVQLSLPRSTPNSFLLEDVAAPAVILRHQPLRDDAFAAVAIRFQKPLQLDIEV